MSKKKFTPSAPRGQSTAQFRAEALVRLRERWEAEREEGETDEWEPEKEPVVSQLLLAAEGGFDGVLRALRSHDDDDARAFVSAYDDCSAKDKKYLPVEALAHASGIGSLRLVEVAQTALFLYASTETKLLISGAMPKVTRAIIDAATERTPITLTNSEGESEVVGYRPGDVRAMELFGKMSGIVPVPKGATIAIQNNFKAPVEEEEGPRVAMSWKSAEDRLREIQELTEPKRLPSPETKPITVGGLIDHMQEDAIHIIRGD